MGQQEKKLIEVDLKDIEAFHSPLTKYGQLPTAIRRFISRKNRSALLKLKGMNISINYYWMKRNAEIATTTKKKAGQLQRQQKIHHTRKIFITHLTARSHNSPHHHDAQNTKEWSGHVPKKFYSIVWNQMTNCPLYILIVEACMQIFILSKSICNIVFVLSVL